MAVDMLRFTKGNIPFDKTEDSKRGLICTFVNSCDLNDLHKIY